MYQHGPSKALKIIQCLDMSLKLNCLSLEFSNVRRAFNWNKASTRSQHGPLIWHSLDMSLRKSCGSLKNVKVLGCLATKLCNPWPTPGPNIFLIWSCPLAKVCLSIVYLKAQSSLKHHQSLTGPQQGPTLPRHGSKIIHAIDITKMTQSWKCKSSS